MQAQCRPVIIFHFLSGRVTLGVEGPHKQFGQFASPNRDKLGRRGGLMVSALGSGSGGPGSSPDWGTAFCSWARYFTLIVPLSTQVYKWVPANLLLGGGGGGGGGNPAMD